MSDIHEGVSIGESGPSQQPVAERALEHLVDAVNDLVRLEIATAASLATACERLHEPEHAELVGEIEAGHRDRMESLVDLVVHLGGAPAETSSLRSLVDRARVRLRERRGDSGVLDVLAAIEAELCERYQQAIAEVGFTDDERDVMAVGLARGDDAMRRLRRAARQPPPP